MYCPLWSNHKAKFKYSAYFLCIKESLVWFWSFSTWEVNGHLNFATILLVSSSNEARILLMHVCKSSFFIQNLQFFLMEFGLSIVHLTFFFLCACVWLKMGDWCKMRSSQETLKNVLEFLVFSLDSNKLHVLKTSS